MNILNKTSQHNLVRSSTKPSLEIRTLDSRIALHNSDGIHLLKSSSISHCKAESNYSFVHLLDGRKLIFSKTLKRMEERLPTRMFIRVHSSFLVRFDLIEFVGSDHLVLSGNIKIAISRSKRKDLIKRIGSVA